MYIKIERINLFVKTAKLPFSVFLFKSKMSPINEFHMAHITWLILNGLRFKGVVYEKPWLNKLTKSEYILSISFASLIFSSSMTGLRKL